ncbi:MAG: hypothetical protein V1755_08735 [Chloroflexota bacterium]
MRRPETAGFIKALGTALLASWLAACTMPVAAPAVPMSLGPAGPETWIDAPLDGMHLPLAPYEVVFHASDEAEIAQVELTINDQPAGLPSAAGAGKNLVTVRFMWSPAAPGQYVLRARSQSLDGNWSGEAQVTVWVGDDTPTPIDTPTITVTPTNTPTPPPGAGPAFSSRVSGNEFYYGGCSPSSIDFEVTVSGGNVDSVVLFLRLNDQSSSGTTGWMAHNSMRPAGGGVYQLTVRATSIEGHEEYQAASVSYQFVATLRNSVVGRSASMSDVVLGACGTVPVRPVVPLIRPPIFIIPSITPQIVK